MMRVDGMRETTYKGIMFLQAQQEAEVAGEHEFICPLCGGKAWWSRTMRNNNLHCGCEKCGYRIME